MASDARSAHDFVMQKSPSLLICPSEDQSPDRPSPEDAYYDTCLQLGSAMPDDDEEIPVIDLSDLVPSTELESSARAKVLDQIGCACKDFGFFQVINHGVESRVIHGIRKAALQFFDEPLEERRRKGGTFYEGSFNPQDSLERLYFRRLPAGESEIDGFKVAPDFIRSQLLEYLDSVERLANVVYGAIFDSLDLKSDCNMFIPKIPRISLGINYYRPCPNPSAVMGLSPHSDKGSITMLHQDGIPGLQMLKNEKWILVKSCHPDAFIVNVADQIEILTNGKYKSVEHRVYNNFNHGRMSIACFFGPTHDTIVAPLPSLVDQNNPSHFKPTLFSDYNRNSQSKRLQAHKWSLDFAKA